MGGLDMTVHQLKERKPATMESSSDEQVVRSTPCLIQGRGFRG